MSTRNINDALDRAHASFKANKERSLNDGVSITLDDEETTWVKFDDMEEMGEGFTQALVDINKRRRKIRSIDVVRSNGVFGFFRKAIGAVITHTGGQVGNS